VTSPLADIAVLDLSHAAAGPYCARLLAEMGASVTKLEAPHGDHFRDVQRGAIHANVNRNKRGIVVDLQTVQGRAIGEQLARKADVIVESLTPGKIGELGLGYERISELNPGVVYVSISGFGQTGPYRLRPGYDVVAQAMSGLMAVTGEQGRPSVRIGTSLVDYSTGLFAAFGVVSALRQRDRTGLGTFIDASLIDTGIAWMDYWFTFYDLTGQLPVRQGSAHEMFAPYQVFETADGAAFVGVSTNRFFDRFCAEFDLDDLAADKRYATNTLRCTNRSALVPSVALAMRNVTTGELLERLQRIGVPSAPVLNLPDVIADPHVQAREVFVQVKGRDGSRLVPRLPLRMSTVGHHPPSPAPALGEHTRSVLSELGYDDTAIELLGKNGIVALGEDGESIDD
jgi:crotonobetainyl-CoA:carnitine CoA-transferase CaiB-like acyl-CoA transferase